MATPQSDNWRIDVYLNDDQAPIIMPSGQLHGLQEAWEKQGRHVQVFAHEDEKPGYRSGRPRLRVIVEPPPDRPLHEVVDVLDLPESDW